MLSFAHGANDVANAIGPLAAINDALLYGGIANKAAIPLWVMIIGAVGIALGLALYGPKLIRTVGSEITDLDQSRAFCIAMAAAITVIIASQLALPVSSTHIAVGAVFGVGFLREYVKAIYARVVHEIELHHQGGDKEVVERFLEGFQRATLQTAARIVAAAQSACDSSPAGGNRAGAVSSKLPRAAGQAFRTDENCRRLGDYRARIRAASDVGFLCDSRGDVALAR